MWIEARSRATGNLLFRYDPDRELIEVKRKNDPAEIVDLRDLKESTGEYHTRTDRQATARSG